MLLEVQVPLKIIGEYTFISLQENPSSGRGIFPNGQTDADMTKLKSLFAIFRMPLKLDKAKYHKKHMTHSLHRIMANKNLYKTSERRCLSLWDLG